MAFTLHAKARCLKGRCSPEMVERLRLQYSEPLAVMDLAQTRGFVAGEVAKWQRVVSETGVKSEE